MCNTSLIGDGLYLADDSCPVFQVKFHGYKLPIKFKVSVLCLLLDVSNAKTINTLNRVLSIHQFVDSNSIF